MDDQQESCREAALRLMDRRAYSRAELTKRLALRKFTRETIATALESLATAGVLDDCAYAREFAGLKLGARNGRSNARVVQDLRRRGLPQAAIAQGMSELTELTGNAAEVDRAVQAGTVKWRLCSRGVEARAARAKLYRFLAGRGFGGDTCRLAIAQITGGAEAE